LPLYNKIMAAVRRQYHRLNAVAYHSGKVSQQNAVAVAESSGRFAQCRQDRFTGVRHVAV
jgi:hypothetical protein